MLHTKVLCVRLGFQHDNNNIVRLVQSLSLFTYFSLMFQLDFKKMVGASNVLRLTHFSEYERFYLIIQLLMVITLMFSICSILAYYKMLYKT